MIAVDTNFIVRLLVGDDTKQQEASANQFHDATSNRISVKKLGMNASEVHSSSNISQVNKLKSVDVSAKHICESIKTARQQ